MTDVSASEAVPTAGLVVSVIVSLVAISVMSSFLTQKYAAVKSWRILPCAMWLVIGIYLDSYFFVFATAILKYGLALKTRSTCEGAIYLCLVAYITSKLIYLFLVEKVYIIRGALIPRTTSKLWCFNTFGMLGGYAVVIVLNFVYRISYLDEGGKCVIGMERRALLPLIIFDLVLNVYLTSLFLIPLFGLYSFQDRQWTTPASKLHKMAVRTFIGSLATLTSAIVNLSVLTALNGEPGWVCLLCCNIDVVWSASMIYWVTYHDHIGSHSHKGSPDNGSRAAKNNGNAPNLNTTRMFSRQQQRRQHNHHDHDHDAAGRDDHDHDHDHDDFAETTDAQTQMHQHHHYKFLDDLEQGRGRGRARHTQQRPHGGKHRTLQFVEVVPPESARLSMWPSTHATSVASPVFITRPEWFDDDDDDETTTSPPPPPPPRRMTDTNDVPVLKSRERQEEEEEEALR